MSTHVDLYCRRCDSYLSSRLNHGEEHMAGLLALAPALAAFGRAVAASDTVCITYLETQRCQAVALAWFVDHEGHDLTVKDEYGVEAEQCGAWFGIERDYGAVTSICTRPRGHGGAHGGIR